MCMHYIMVWDLCRTGHETVFKMDYIMSYYNPERLAYLSERRPPIQIGEEHAYIYFIYTLYMYIYKYDMDEFSIV